MKAREPDAVADFEEAGNKTVSIAGFWRLWPEHAALVLVGGGAKCAYQLGVWRGLWERGIRSFVTMSGTSGGAINAMLFAGG